MRWWLCLIITAILMLFLICSCDNGFIRVFSQSDPNKVVAEAKGKPANTLSQQLAKERELNQRLNATAQQAANRATWTLYSVATLFIILSAIVACFRAFKTALTLGIAGVAIFLLARLLQQFAVELIIGVVVLVCLFLAYYIYRFHDTIFKLNGKGK